MNSLNHESILTNPLTDHPLPPLADPGSLSRSIFLNLGETFLDSLLNEVFEEGDADGSHTRVLIQVIVKIVLIVQGGEIRSQESQSLFDDWLFGSHKEI
jgi:hypothetical protein